MNPLGSLPFPYYSLATLRDATYVRASRRMALSESLCVRYAPIRPLPHTCAAGCDSSHAKCAYTRTRLQLLAPNSGHRLPVQNTPTSPYSASTTPKPHHTTTEQSLSLLDGVITACLGRDSLSTDFIRDRSRLSRLCSHGNRDDALGGAVNQQPLEAPSPPSRLRQGPGFTFTLFCFVHMPGTCSIQGFLICFPVLYLLHTMSS